MPAASVSTPAKVASTATGAKSRAMSGSAGGWSALMPCRIGPRPGSAPQNAGSTEQRDEALAGLTLNTVTLDRAPVTELRFQRPAGQRADRESATVIPLSAPGITLLPWLLWSEPRLFWLLLVPDTSAPTSGVVAALLVFGVRLEPGLL